MNGGKIIFAQLMDHLPQHTFRRCVARYRGDHKVKRFWCIEQYLCMAFAQLTFRESLRDIETCLRAQSAKLYHMGIRAPVARNTLANANRGARLADLRRFRASADRDGPTPLRRGRLRGRAGPDRLCVRCDDDRPLPGVVPLGALPARPKAR